MFCLDDQPEINEYLKYQRIIRELKDENSHLRDEMANLRKSFKSQQSEKKQVEIKSLSSCKKKNKDFFFKFSLDEKMI